MTSKRKFDESESEAEVASEAPTGDVNGDDDEQMSELSSLDEHEFMLTPKPSKPPKKKARDASSLDTPVKSSGKGMVNATHHFGASKSKSSVGGPAGAM